METPFFDELKRLLRIVSDRGNDYEDMLSLFETFRTDLIDECEFLNVAQDIIYDLPKLFEKLVLLFHALQKEYLVFQSRYNIPVAVFTWRARVNERPRRFERGELHQFLNYRITGYFSDDGTIPWWNRTDSVDSGITDDDRQTSTTGLTSTDTSLPSTSSDKSSIDVPDLPQDHLPSENPESPSKKRRLERDQLSKDLGTPSDDCPKDSETPSDKSPKNPENPSDECPKDSETPSDKSPKDPEAPSE